MFGCCAQLFREGLGQGAVNAGMLMHFKSQQRRTKLSRKSPSGELAVASCGCYSFANLPCDEPLSVSLSHTTKRQ